MDSQVHILAQDMFFDNFFHFSFSAELGDHDETTHTPAFVSEFRFVPNQNEDFEIDVFETYKKLK